MTSVGRVSCWVAACWIVLTTIPLAEIPIARSRTGAVRADPFDLLPESSVLVVELRDVAKRWDEIRGIRAIARFQDRALGPIGIGPEELPELLGDRALLALVADEQRGGLFPVAVLQPDRPDRALARLTSVLSQAAVPSSAERRGDLVTVAPAAFAGCFEDTPPESRNSSRKRLHLEEVAARLSEGGLVRGWVDPLQASRVLSAGPPWNAGPFGDLLAEMLAAKLEITRFAGFRRELTPRGLATEAVAVFDLAALPVEVREVFRPAATPRVLPRDLPPEVVAISVFGTEPRAVLAWLRHVAEGAPRGSLRNLDFWLGDLERGTGVDVERDLLDLLGERAWVMALRGDEREPLHFAAVFEARDAEQLERNLLRVVPWISGQIVARTLGFARAELSEGTLGGDVVNALSIRTPVGEYPGPRFVVNDRRLVFGSSDRALIAGAELATNLALPPSITVREPGHAAGPHESMLVSGRALADLVSALVTPGLTGHGAGLADAVVRLLADLDEVAIDVRYVDDGVRLRGRMEFH